ncbi:P-type ATPase [Aphelenchoides avenae]|nr:P-type ATPase [Aphelenchus avenae]
MPIERFVVTKPVPASTKKKTPPRYKVASVEKAADLGGSFTEHTLDVSELRNIYKQSNIDHTAPTRSRGLAEETAKELLQSNGPNALPKQKEINGIQLFVTQFFNPFWLLLLFADGLSLLSYLLDPTTVMNLYIAIIILAMVVSMCTLSWWQEREARRIIRGFEKLLPPIAIVVRNGSTVTVPATQIVVGDIVKIRIGMRVCADTRMLWCSHLKLETSSITGESNPVEYQSDAIAASTSIFEARNIAFNGSLCVDGDGVGVVIRTGANTIISQIANLTNQDKKTPNRLQKQTNNFLKFLLIVWPVMGLVMFVIGGFNDRWANISLMISSSFLVCAIAFIPEGMPATITTIMTVVARRLAKKHVYVKRLDIVEALGSCNIIASDKTGTLTKNLMTVTDLWYQDEFISGWPTGYKRSVIQKSSAKPQQAHPLVEILNVMSVCNSSEFVDANLATAKVMLSYTRNTSTVQRLKRWKMQVARGTPSDIAMLKYADELVDVLELRKQYPVVYESPFNSSRKYHLVITKLRNVGDGNATYKLFIKGAADVLIEKCSSVVTENGIEELNKQNMEHFEYAYNHFGEQGHRVIGFAEKEFTAPERERFSELNIELTGLVFCGLCAIMDPPREETASAIQTCKEAGIKVFMITGDHQTTAKAIAQQVGLIGETQEKDPDWEIVPGDRLSMLTDSEWDRLFGKKCLIFARTTPEQKLLIVDECQKRKQVIAMTGDGVNDAPALKRADIGVAMGSGSEVARQAADIVLMDDNFASIVCGVYEGRTIYDNIKKLLAYTLFRSFPELLGTFVSFCLGMPIGITMLQVMAIELGMEIPPGIALAFEPGEGDVMKVPPRHRKLKLICFSLLAYAFGYAQLFEALAGFLSYCCVYWTHGINVRDLWMTDLTPWKVDPRNLTSNGVVYDIPTQLAINREASAAWMVGIVVVEVRR